MSRVPVATAAFWGRIWTWGKAVGVVLGDFSGGVGHGEKQLRDAFRLFPGDVGHGNKQLGGGAWGFGQYQEDFWFKKTGMFAGGGGGGVRVQAPFLHNHQSHLPSARGR